MNENTEVTFKLSIGYAGAEHEETFTLGELNIDPENEDVEKRLDEEWSIWINNYLDGGWEIQE